MEILSGLVQQQSGVNPSCTHARTHARTVLGENPLTRGLTLNLINSDTKLFLVRRVQFVNLTPGSETRLQKNLQQKQQQQRETLAFTKNRLRPL